MWWEDGLGCLEFFNRGTFPAYCRLHPASSDQGYGGSDGTL